MVSHGVKHQRLGNFVPNQIWVDGFIRAQVSHFFYR